MPEDTGARLITDTSRTISNATDGRGDTVLRAVERNVSVLRVSGDIDLTTHIEFQTGLARVLGDDPDRIVLDCTAMTFCGARGLRALMATVASGAERGTDVAVVGFSPMLHRLCAQLWPGPQPAPYPSVTAAVEDAARRGAAPARHGRHGVYGGFPGGARVSAPRSTHENPVSPASTRSAPPAWPVARRQVQEPAAAVGSVACGFVRWGRRPVRPCGPRRQPRARDTRVACARDGGAGQ